jgi:hypothetical protein
MASAFEPSFRAAAASARLEPGAAEPEAASPSLFAVKGLGTPALVDARTVSIPVRFQDSAGCERRLTLRLRIEAVEEERA